VKTLTAIRDIPQVAVLVETSLAAGRDMLGGIAEYVRRYGPWRIYLEPHDIDKPPPAWFRRWHGDGIIVRLHDARIAEAVAGKAEPVVDVLGVHGRGRYPLVHTDNRAIGRLAADHFHERGFVSYGFAGIRDESWSDERQRAYAERVAEFGYDCAVLTWSNQDERRTPLSARTKRIAAWLRTLRLPVGVYVSSDARAIVAAAAARAWMASISTGSAESHARM